MSGETAASQSLGRRNPEQRRDSVLESARELFVEQGIDRTSVDSIARRAGVAKGTVYLYFSSKDEIIRALEQEFNERVVSRVRAASEAAEAAGGGLEEVVSAWCADLTRAYLDDLALHDMLFAGNASASREAAADNVLVNDLAELLAEFGADGPMTHAAFLVGGITLVVDRAIVAHHRSGRGTTGTPYREALAEAAANLAGVVIRGMDA